MTSFSTSSSSQTAAFTTATTTTRSSNHRIRPYSTSPTTTTQASMVPATGLEVELLRLTKNVLTASGTGITGDLIAQFASSRRNGKQQDSPTAAGSGSGPLNNNFQWDSRRTMALATFNAAYTGAFQHFYFPHLNAAVGSPALRLLINQGIMIPLLYYPIFCFLIPLLRAKTRAERHELRRSIPSVKRLIPRNWAFWLPLQFIQFKFVPAGGQVAFCSVCGLVWSILLSLFASSSSSSATKQAQTQLVREQPPVSVANINQQETVRVVKRIIPQASTPPPPPPPGLVAVPATS